jgi:hypothetical protein
MGCEYDNKHQARLHVYEHIIYSNFFQLLLVLTDGCCPWPRITKTTARPALLSLESLVPTVIMPAFSDSCGCNNWANNPNPEFIKDDREANKDSIENG